MLCFMIIHCIFFYHTIFPKLVFVLPSSHFLFSVFQGFVSKWIGAPFLWSTAFSQFLGSGFLSCLLLLISHIYSLQTQTTFIWRASLAPNNGPKWMDFIWWQQHSHFRTNFSTKHTHSVKYMYHFNNTPPDPRSKVYNFSTIHRNAELQQIHTDCYNTLSSNIQTVNYLFLHCLKHIQY